MSDDTTPGLAIDWAHRIIRAHAAGEGCGQCRDGWCPTAEWAVWACVSDYMPPAEQHLLTVVARQVVQAHWPRSVDGCRPCGLDDCDRIRIAGAWLDAVRDPFLPPVVMDVPTPEELHRITGM